MDLLHSLDQLGLELPEATRPGGAYQSVNVRGNVAFVAIQFPIRNGEFLYRGRLGAALTTKDGYNAMQLCALNTLSQVHHKVGFARVEGLNHIEACYCPAEEWDEAPEVVNGASDLFLQALGEKGRHSRSIFGVYRLPRNFCAGLTASFTLK